MKDVFKTALSLVTHLKKMILVEVYCIWSLLFASWSGTAECGHEAVVLQHDVYAGPQLHVKQRRW